MNDVARAARHAPKDAVAFWEEECRAQLIAYEMLADRVAPDMIAVLEDPTAPWTIRVEGCSVVDSLEDLSGPARGIVELTHEVLPGEPRRLFNLGNPRHAWALYGLLLWRGTSDQLRAWINRDLLIQMWNPSIAPLVIRGIWENRFPELAFGTLTPLLTQWRR
jgi:hypothetical protein